MGGNAGDAFSGEPGWDLDGGGIPATRNALEVTGGEEGFEGAPVGDGSEVAPRRHPTALGEQAAHRGVGEDFGHPTRVPRAPALALTLSTGRTPKTNGLGSGAEHAQ